MMILKVTKTQGFTLSLEDTFFEKQQGGVKLTPPIRFRVKNFAKFMEKHLCQSLFFNKVAGLSLQLY